MISHLSGLLPSLIAQYTWFSNRSPPRIPEVRLSEEPFLQVAAALRFEINRALAVLRVIASGRDLKKFLAVSYFLYRNYWIIAF